MMERRCIATVCPGGYMTCVRKAISVGRMQLGSALRYSCPSDLSTGPIRMRCGRFWRTEERESAICYWARPLAITLFLQQLSRRLSEADQKSAAYVQLAREAAQGEVPGSFAGGEQPKFVAYAVTPNGPQHLIVKFSERETGPVTERWRDLLLAEHLALTTLRDAGVPAAQTWIVDTDDQRFLEVERFDRVGALGRRGVFSPQHWMLNLSVLGLELGRASRIDLPPREKSSPRQSMAPESCGPSGC